MHRGGRGQSFVYELLFTRSADDRTPVLEGLIDVEKLIRHEYDEKKSGLESRLSGSSRPQVGQVSGYVKTASEPMQMRVPQQSSRTIAENTYTASTS